MMLCGKKDISKKYTVFNSKILNNLPACAVSGVHSPGQRVSSGTLCYQHTETNYIYNKVDNTNLNWLSLVLNSTQLLRPASLRHFLLAKSTTFTFKQLFTLFSTGPESVVA